MTNPGPLGGGDRPLTGPDTDLFAAGEVPPAAVPPPPAYEPTELLEPAPETELLDPTPEYDSLAEDTVFEIPLTSVAVEPLVVEEIGYLAEPPVRSGPLAAVTSFAAERPAVFLGAALAAGWLVGRILSSSDDD